MADINRAELQYALDMSNAADFLRLRLNMAQCIPVAEFRDAAEEEILIDYLATVYAVYRAYKGKATVLYGFTRGINGTGS